MQDPTGPSSRIAEIVELTRKPQAEQPCTLYRYFDAEGQLLYVGITFRQYARAKHHAIFGKFWNQAASATFEHYPSRREAELAERAAIRAERPAHNIQHQPDRIIPDKRIGAIHACLECGTPFTEVRHGGFGLCLPHYRRQAKRNRKQRLKAQTNQHTGT